MKRFITEILNNPSWSEFAADNTLPTTVGEPLSPELQSESDIQQTSSGVLHSMFPDAPPNAPFEWYDMIIKAKGIAAQNATLMYEEAAVLRNGHEALVQSKLVDAASYWKQFLIVQECRTFCRNTLYFIVEGLVPSTPPQNKRDEAFINFNKCCLGQSDVFRAIGNPAVQTVPDDVKSMLEANYESQVQNGKIQPFQSRRVNPINSPIGEKYN